MTTSSASIWTGTVQVSDTALAVTDTGGCGVPVVYFNGQFCAQSCWRRVVSELGSDYRHIRYDMRARGRSERSSDNSFEANLGDVDAILEARGLNTRRADRPLLVGWSYGAAIAVHWASRNPNRVRGVVSVDGAYPYGGSAALEEKIQRLFQRLRWVLPLVRPLGMAARMSADEHAESNIEILRVLREIGPVLDRIVCPARFVVATGAHLGASPEEMQQVRATLDPVLARNRNIQVSAMVTSNHGNILRKDFRAVAEAVRELAVVSDRALLEEVN